MKPNKEGAIIRNSKILLQNHSKLNERMKPNKEGNTSYVTVASHFTMDDNPMLESY